MALKTSKNKILFSKKLFFLNLKMHIATSYLDIQISNDFRQVGSDNPHCQSPFFSKYKFHYSLQKKSFPQKRMDKYGFLLTRGPFTQPLGRTDRKSWLTVL